VRPLAVVWLMANKPTTIFNQKLKSGKICRAMEFNFIFIHFQSYTTTGSHEKKQSTWSHDHCM